MNIAPGFEKALRKYKLERLERHRGTIYGLWPDRTLGYFNEAWVRFARENGGDPAIFRDWNLGANIMEAIPEALCGFYEDLYNRCTATFQAQGFYYECSSARYFRRFSQIVYPLKDGALLSVHSCVVEHRHELEGREPKAPDPDTYSKNGLIHQCCHCRRVRNMKVYERWDWVPEYVRVRHPNISHGLCPTCFGYFRQLDAQKSDYPFLESPVPE